MNTTKRKIDPATTVIPFIIILALCTLFVIKPEGSTNVIGIIRSFLGDKLGLYYLVIGLGILLVSFWIAFSDIGKIRLGGKDEKPQYNFFTWGSMIFTCGLAADILFYSFCEWIYYAGESRVSSLGSIQDWASTMPLFHWGPIPWSFYAVLAACFGFMLHVRGCTKQKYSESCRPLLGEKTDKLPGKIIDVLAVIALIAGTATTFSVSMPLLSTSISELVGLPDTKWLSIIILLVICTAYTMAVITGMKGVSYLAKICMYVFGALLVYVLILGGKTFYILETGFSALGNMVQNFIGLSTYTDPLRENSFPQNWTIFYWAYWLVWCVASPFFMGSVSRGRTVKQVILGSYIFGMSATLVSFVVLGNYGLGMQLSGAIDAIGLYEHTGTLYTTVIAIIKTLPGYQIVLVLLIVSMISFYSTSFDSITLVASAYSYKQIGDGEEASTKMKLFWAILLIMLPIALLFNESTMANLQAVSIIAAFPIAIVIIMIIASFIKDAKRYIKN
ncbi:MAG: BCCT family transporter [Treponema sp.]|nr:BCCT family transporter [Treponema sp.]